MEAIVFVLFLFVIWLLTRVAALQKESNEARGHVKILFERMREMQRQVTEIKQSAVPRAAETARESDKLRSEFEEHRSQLLEDLPTAASPPLSPAPARSASDEASKTGDFTQWEAHLPDGKKIPSFLTGGAARKAADTPPVPQTSVQGEEEKQRKPTAPAMEAPRPPEPKEAFSLEKFMGVKLFAWLGGVAMFFGVIFFVKYAFEKNLIPPSMRIALGFVTGAALLGGGLWTHRLPKYRVLAQAFCATGILILYGVTFAAHSIYHFPAFGPASTLVIMAMVTVAAFLIAVRLDALVVAVLGMLGGFLTPVLVSTGQDQVFGLFGYIALLDIGLLAVSRQRNWSFLASAAAVGTAVMQAGWFGEFFDKGHYEIGAKTLVPMGILLFFILIFLAGGWLGRKGREMDEHAAGSVLGLTAVAMIFGFAMLGYGQVANRYFLLYGFLLLVQLPVIALVMVRPGLGMAQVIAAGLVFLHLACWTVRDLTRDNLNAMLAIYLVFGGLHAVIPVWLARRPGSVPAVWPLRAGPWFAPLVVLMMLLPVFRLSPVPIAIWVAVLILDLLAIGLAAVTGALLSVLVSLVLTMVVAALWLVNGPTGGGMLTPFLGVVTGFSALFSLGAGFLLRTISARQNASPFERKTAEILPVFSGLLPFGMLILALLHSSVGNPSPVFLVALLMSALLAGLAIYGKQGALVLAALAGTLAVEGIWHTQEFRPELSTVGFSWYLGFYALFLVFPFVFRKACADRSGPWIASALSGVGHFLLIHNGVKQAYPNDIMGLIPAAFAVPALASLFAALRMFPQMDGKQQSRLAWFGGTALLFITLIFPIQFERQWITVSWAIEGALLIWLFRRVPHPGLQFTGLLLLGVSFIRLTLNQAIFTEYPRSGMAIFNWHLYTYGLVAAAHFFGAGWFIDPVGRWKDISPRAVLFGMGGVLLFLLLNLEIADYFTPPSETRVTFTFGGNFARSMTYSICWGLFSLGLLGIGIWRKSKHARYAAIGLLGVTLLKLFLQDLASIESIFRIGALIGVAVIAFFASFLYQRFFDRTDP